MNPIQFGAIAVADLRQKLNEANGQGVKVKTQPYIVSNNTVIYTVREMYKAPDSDMVILEVDNPNGKSAGLNRLYVSDIGLNGDDQPVMLTYDFATEADEQLAEKQHRSWWQRLLELV